MSKIKRGRPRISNAGIRINISISLRPEEYIKLESLERETNATKSQIVRAAINVLYKVADLKGDVL